MPTSIFVQDRNNIVPFKDLYTMPVLFNDILMGINLYSGKHMIGTFDSIAEAMEEIDKIHRSKYDVYLVTSFISTFRDWDIITECMREDAIWKR